LCHKAGLPAVREALPAEAMLNWSMMTEAIARQEPWWPPGQRHGYHVNTFGFLVGEVVRRVYGHTLGSFLHQEIAAPLGADVHIGLPAKEDQRVADFIWSQELSRPDAASVEMQTDEQLMLRNTYFNPIGLSGHGVVNTPPWRRAEIPSTNGHATARGVARVY